MDDEDKYEKKIDFFLFSDKISTKINSIKIDKFKFNKRDYS